MNILMEFDMIQIREATDSDFDDIWTIFHAVVKRGDTYAFSPETIKEEAYDIWMKKPLVTYVAVSDENIIGTYYLKPNQPGLGAHVCNAGFMVHPESQEQGTGKAMGEHALMEARRLGFNAFSHCRWPIGIKSSYDSYIFDGSGSFFDLNH